MTRRYKLTASDSVQPRVRYSGDDVALIDAAVRVVSRGLRDIMRDARHDVLDADISVNVYVRANDDGMSYRVALDLKYTSLDDEARERASDITIERA